MYIFLFFILFRSISSSIHNSDVNSQYLISALVNMWKFLAALIKKRRASFFRVVLYCRDFVTQYLTVSAWSYFKAEIGDYFRPVMSCLKYIFQYCSAQYRRLFSVHFLIISEYTTLKKISVMHVIKLGFAPVSFPPG